MLGQNLHRYFLFQNNYIAPLFMGTAGSMPHSQGISSNPYSQPNQANSSY